MRIYGLPGTCLDPELVDQIALEHAEERDRVEALEAIVREIGSMDLAEVVASGNKSEVAIRSLILRSREVLK